MADEVLDKGYFVDSILLDVILSTEMGFYGENPIEIILTVGGYLIGGQLISHKEWFENQISPPEQKQGEKETAESKPEETEPEAAKANDGEKEQPNYVRKFIHLKNAKFFHGNTQIPVNTDGFYWRGKLTSVDGFMFGSLGIEKGERRKHTIKVGGQTIEID
jgi:hypothetical protein